MIIRPLKIDSIFCHHSLLVIPFVRISGKKNTNFIFYRKPEILVCVFHSVLPQRFSKSFSLPDRSAVYKQCSGVYTACTLQAKQCSCSVHCPCSIRYTADCSVDCLYTLQCTEYTSATLHGYTACTLQSMQCSCSLHCPVHAVYVQCTLQLPCSYTACTLHFGLG